MQLIPDISILFEHNNLKMESDKKWQQKLV